MKTVKINDRTYQVNEMQDWTGSFSKQFHAGEYVDQEIVDHFRNVLPPRSLEPGYLQVGEPHSHRMDKNGRGRATYATFKKEAQNVWQFCGYCFADEIENQQ